MDYIESIASTTASIVGVLSVIIGGIYALYQFHQSNKIKRAEFLIKLWEQLYGDISTHEWFLKIDYDQFTYNKDFHGSDGEKFIDKILSFFSNVCYLKSKNLIGDLEFDQYKYQIYRILKNKDIICYLFNIYHFSKKIKLPPTYEELISYGRKNMIIPSDFENPESRNYIKTLNF